MSVSQRSHHSSPNRQTSASPRHPAVRVDDTPIQDFVRVIDNTPSGAWQKRTTAFESLIKLIPEGSDYHASPAWYNNPPTLRHLANPISELLKDARSTVVKRTCGCLLTLFSRCQSDARYLFKDMMVTVLSVHAQTVQVIRQAVQFMVMEAIPEVPCKMVMPLWMERLKIDKSRTVRDACALYLGQALQSWTDEAYLTEEIWSQVGRALIGSLRDPSPAVRTTAKAALQNMQQVQPIFFDNLINDPEGPAASDTKLNRWLLNLGQGNNPDTEELSVMSRISYNSDIRNSRTAKVSGSGASVGSQTGRTPSRSSASPRNTAGVPTSIALGTSTTQGRATVNGSTNNSVSSSSRPPMASAPPAAAAPISRRSELIGRSSGHSTSSNHKTATAATAPLTPSRTPSRPTTTAVATAKPYATPDAVTSPMEDSVSPIATGDLSLHGDEPNKPATSPTAFPADLGVPALRGTMPASAGAPDRVPADERQSASGVVSPSLTKPAAQRASTKAEPAEAEASSFSERRNRNSVLIQQRLKMSSSDLADEEPAPTSSYENGETSRPPKFPAAGGGAKPTMVESLPSPHVPPPEHMVIAIRLLKAHKAHVDAIMETLRIEMDTLRDFDRLLEEPGRPTEDEVLDYFESVGLCLEQRTVAGVQMQEELDRVSRGEPPQE